MSLSQERGWHIVGTKYWRDYNKAPIFPGGSAVKEPTCQSRRHKRLGFSPWVRKIPLEEELSTHSNILAEEIPWVVELMGSQRAGYDWVHMHHHHTDLQVVNFQTWTCIWSQQGEPVPLTSGVSEIAACPLCPIADASSTLLFPTSSPSSSH